MSKQTDTYLNSLSFSELKTLGRSLLSNPSKYTTKVELVKALGRNEAIKARAKLHRVDNSN